MIAPGAAQTLVGLGREHLSPRLTLDTIGVAPPLEQLSTRSCVEVQIRPPSLPVARIGDGAPDELDRSPDDDLELEHVLSL